MKASVWLSSFMFLITLGSSFGTIKYDGTWSQNFIGTEVSILTDSLNDVDFNNVSSRIHDFAVSEAVIPNLGLSKNPIWITFELTNESTDELLLSVNHPSLDDIRFYDQSKNAGKSLGQVKRFFERDFHTPDYIFDLDIDENETKRYFLRVKTSEQVLLPLELGSRKTIINSELNKDLILGIYIGFVLIMLVYNFFIYLSTRDKNYFFYVIYVFWVGLAQSNVHGYVFKYLTPNNPQLSLYNDFFLPAVAAIFSILFVIVFLNLKKHSRLIYFLLVLQIFLLAFACIAPLFGWYAIAYQLVQLGTGLAAIIILVGSISLAVRKIPSAKFIAIGWSIFIFGVVLFILRELGILPSNNFTLYSMQAGSAVEILLFSFALADKINIYKKERLEAIEDKEKLLREQNIVLEQQVKERTQELIENNNKLNTTLNKLKETQTQLVQAEKMASLGQLTAGIAHEINNPMNYTKQSISTVKKDLEDLREILNEYASLNADVDLDEKLKEIEDLKEDLEYDYLQTELDEAIEDIEDGIARTIDIASGLKTFSRLDESKLKEANLEDGIDSTLKLMNSKFLDGKVHVERKYAGLPNIECNAGRINQVFMNIIENSLYAVLKNLKVEEKRIIIETKQEGDLALFQFTDNGIGMDAVTLEKVFDPFYTTKDVGEGTGLGMSVSHGIIKDHGGKIEIESQPNEGTRIIISLPLHSPETPAS